MDWGEGLLGGCGEFLEAMSELDSTVISPFSTVTWSFEEIISQGTLSRSLREMSRSLKYNLGTRL